MIERKDILSLAYLKKAVFSGSYEGMRFRFAAVKKELPPAEGEEKGAEEQVLEIAVWEGPYAYDVVPEEKKQRSEMEFSEEGIRKGIDFLNELWISDQEKWKAAKARW